MTAQIARKAGKLNWHMRQTKAGQVVAWGKPEPQAPAEQGYYIDIKVGSKTTQKRFNSARALHKYMTRKLEFYRQQLSSE